MIETVLESRYHRGKTFAPMVRQKTDFLLQIHVHPDINNITVYLKVMLETLESGPVVAHGGDSGGLA